MFKTPTTEMEVTSVRLERELKEALKEIALTQGRGYQSLLRDVLWNFIGVKSIKNYRLTVDDVLSTTAAVCSKETRCAITGNKIEPNSDMLLGLTTNGILVPLSCQAIDQPSA